MAERAKGIPVTISRYQVPCSILRQSAEVLRDLSAGLRESVLLWRGRVLNASTAEITGIIVPRQSANHIHFEVPLEERMRIACELAEGNEVALVQLHTHPDLAFHSAADDKLAIIRHIGAVSVVVPYFASVWSGDVGGAAVYIHLGASKWRRIAQAAARRQFEVIP